MQTIWKTELALTDVQEVMLPIGSTILCAREQNERACIWYRCDPMQKTEPRKIVMVGTGHRELDEGDQYLGTAHLRGGSLVLHVFERIM
jgi:hypothetical protein